MRNWDSKLQGGYGSEDETLVLGCLFWWRFEGCHDSLEIVVLGGFVSTLDRSYLIKDILQLVLCQGTALNIFHRTQLFRHPLTIFLPHWCHLLLCQFLFD